MTGELARPINQIASVITSSVRRLVATSDFGLNLKFTAEDYGKEAHFTVIIVFKVGKGYYKLFSIFSFQDIKK